MKSDAAAVRVVNRTGEQMVHIYEHGKYHNKPDNPPSIRKQVSCDNTRYDKVQRYMNEGMYHEVVFAVSGDEDVSRMIPSASFCNVT
jgi:hypothetical protein